MSNVATLPPGVNRFLEHCSTHGIHPRVIVLGCSGQSAEQAAQALGCDVAQVVKSIVFIGKETDQNLMVLVSGKNRANPQRLAEILGEKVRLATPEEVQARTGYPIGSVPPFSTAKPMTTIVDEDLADMGTLWTSAGSDFVMAELSLREIQSLSQAKAVQILTPEAAPVRIVPYDPTWPKRFLEEKTRLESVASRFIPRFEHIGSTAVPGLPSKPIIDILGGANSLETDTIFIPPILALGYRYVPEYEVQMPERRYLTRTEDGQVTVHLHIVERSSPIWAVQLAFRDRLIQDPDLREAYASLKLQLAEQYGQDRIGYTNAKSDFIRNALRE